MAWITGKKEANEPDRPKYDKDDPRYEMERFREKARRSGKLTPKLEASMAGLEQMLEGVSDMGKQFNSQIEDLGNQAKRSMHTRNENRKHMI